MRISDWSSDVCSSDLGNPVDRRLVQLPHRRVEACVAVVVVHAKSSSCRCSAARARDRCVFTEPSLHFMIRAVSATANSSSTRSVNRSEEHTSELQSLMRLSYAVFCLQKKTQHTQHRTKTE